MVVKGVLVGNYGVFDSINVQGEVQKKFDVLINEVIFCYCEWGGQLVGMVFEEMDDFYLIFVEYLCGCYLLVFDLFDGFLNSDVNVLVGIIFFIFVWLIVGDVELGDYLCFGSEQVVVGYVIYGLLMMMVLIFGNGMYGFMLDCENGNFILIYFEICVLVEISEFVINMFNECFWELLVQCYVSECKVGKIGVCGVDFNMCWIVLMVVEVYCILICGGIFMYLKDSKDFGKFGCFCLFYEVNLMVMLIEQVGGVVSIGCGCIFDVQLDVLYQCVLVIFGLKNEVECLMCYYVEYDEGSDCLFVLLFFVECLLFCDELCI